MLAKRFTTDDYFLVGVCIHSALFYDTRNRPVSCNNLQAFIITVYKLRFSKESFSLTTVRLIGRD